MRLDVVLWNGDNAGGEGVDILELTPQSPPPVGSDLTELEERFLTLLSSEATLSRTQMAERLEMGLDTVKEYLRKLREKGYIERLGGNRRTGRWVVKK